MNLRRLTLAMAMAAVAAIALAAAGPASATVLCKATESPCSETNLLHANAEIKADLTPATSDLIETTSGVVIDSCSGSALLGIVEKPGSATEATFIAVPSVGLTWSGCSAGQISTASSGEWQIQYKEGTDNGTLRDNSNPFGKRFGITLGECTYTLPWGELGEHIGLVTGGSGSSGEWSAVPRIDVHTRLVKTKGGATCWEDVMWIATYALTSPAPLYVRPS